MTVGKKFAVFDIDGTLVRWQLYHAVADALAKEGYIDSTSYGIIRDARMKWKQRSHPESFKEYEKQLIKSYESILRVLTPEQFDQAANAVFKEYKDQVYTFTRGLIKTLKERKYLLFAISGSQVEVVEKIAKYYGFDDCVGTVYAREKDKFTGERIVGSTDKATILSGLIKKHSAISKDSVAVGDSASDVSMMEMVQMPIAFNPDKALFMLAKQRGWSIVLERKNMVYELEKRNGQYVLVKTS